MHPNRNMVPVTLRSGPAVASRNYKEKTKPVPPAPAAVVFPSRDKSPSVKARGRRLRTAVGKVVDSGKHRALAMCSHGLVNRAAGVDVYKHAESRDVRLYGVHRCKNDMACPTCAYEASCSDRAELAAGLVAMRELGRVFFITYTVHHTKHDDVVALTDALMRARQAMRNSKGFKALKRRLDHVGAVRNLELTYHNYNGWHPHIHELFFCIRDVEADELRPVLAELWQAACAKVGLVASLDRGVTLGDSSWTHTDYLSKIGHERAWDLDRELAMSQNKKGRGRATRYPFDFLEMYLNPRSAREQAFAADRYREYVAATAGHHHVRWSSGLRGFLNSELPEWSEPVEADERLYQLFGNLSAPLWDRVRAVDGINQFLELCESEDTFAGVLAWVESLPEPSPAVAAEVARFDGTASELANSLAESFAADMAEWRRARDEPDVPV